MASLWRALLNEKSTGPMSGAELLRAHFRGQYGADTLVCEEGASDWRKLAEAFPLASLTPPPIPADIAATAPSAPAKAGAWASDTPYAWRRYFARQLDTLLHAWLMFVFLGAALAGSDAAYLAVTETSNAIVLNIVGVALAVVPGVILIGATGRTFGKLVFGVKVLNARHKPPGLWRALKRELQVLFQGLAVGLPLLPLFTFIAGFLKLRSEGRTDWDAGNDLTTWYRRPTIVHWILMLGGVALWLSILAFMIAAGRNAG